MEEKLMSMKDLLFTIDEEMEETIIEMLVIQQILDKEELSKRERKMFENFKFNLLDKFRYKLHILNPTQITMVKTIIDSDDSKKN